jgi:hypothetical protein
MHDRPHWTFHFLQEITMHSFLDVFQLSVDQKLTRLSANFWVTITSQINDSPLPFVREVRKAFSESFLKLSTLEKVITLFGPFEALLSGSHITNVADSG